MLEQLPILVIVIPLVVAPLCVFTGGSRLPYTLALLASWACLAISGILKYQVNREGALRYDIGGWAPPYGIEYVIDSFSAFVMLIVSGLAAMVMLYAPRSIRHEIDPAKHYLFYATFLLCMTGLLGMCATGDLFNLFVFLEISSLSSYALISLGRTRRAPLAAFQYLILGSIGATFLLIGIGLLYQMTGTLNMADIASRIDVVDGPRTLMVSFAFLTVGLFIKMAVFPLHTWLPNAYTYAPSAVTCFIAATATKVSVYAFVRLVYTIFTPDFALVRLPLETLLLVLSMVGIFAASLSAIFQENVKRLLAFSSVAQIGYMLLGVSMANEDGLTAGIVHMFNHAIIKGSLFMVVGCFALRLGSTHLTDWRGAGRTMPWTSLAWALAGLGLIGVPLTSGFVSKWLLLTSSMKDDRWTVAVLMLVSSLLAVVYVWRVVETLFFSDPEPGKTPPKEAPKSLLVPTYLLIFCVYLFGVWTTYNEGLARQAAATLLSGVEL